VTARRLTTSDADLDLAAAALRRGELVGMPTETVYGLAGNALDPATVAAIFAAKGRPGFDPLIVHALDRQSAFELSDAPPEAAVRLAEAFWPGPLTLVVPRTALVPDLAAAGLPTVALRVPAHPVARELLRRSGLRLAAPSANPFGGVSPTTAEHVLAGLGGVIGWVVDAGACERGLESTVVSFETGEPTILRHGALPMEAIEARVGRVSEGARVLERPLAPGQLARHYAPRVALRLSESAAALPGPAPDAGLLVCVGPAPAGASRWGHVECLSPEGQIEVAASRLFAALHHLDTLGLSRVDVLLPPDAGLGRAMRDRLRRAAVRSADG
jgi:L-threonylcarbamoyladenylate synthase